MAMSYLGCHHPTPDDILNVYDLCRTYCVKNGFWCFYSVTAKDPNNSFYKNVKT